MLQDLDILRDKKNKIEETLPGVFTPIRQYFL
jgi:hypothetical protein